MFPFYIGVLITVPVGSVVVEIKFVLAGISHEIEGVPAVDDMCQAEIGIVEVSAAVAVGRVGYVFKQPVRVAGSQAQDQRCLFFFYGPL